MAGDTEGSPEILVYGTRWCPDCIRARVTLRRLKVPYLEIDITKDPEAAEIVTGINGGLRSVPTMIFPDGSVLTEPSALELTAKIGKWNSKPD
jgi:mycoredoxin